MLPDRVSNPGPLTYESGALPIALRGPACLVCNFSIVATCPSIQLPALLFVCILFLLFVDVLSGEPKQN